VNQNIEHILTWFAEQQPEMKLELNPPQTALLGTSFSSSRIHAKGRYAIPFNGEKYGYELSIIIPAEDDDLFIPEVYCVDRLLYPSLNRHILSNGQACLGTLLDILRTMQGSHDFSVFAKKIIDPFIIWQLYYDTFGMPPAWGERSHGFAGDIQSIAEYLSDIWRFPSSLLNRMLCEYKPKKRKKCFCGSKLQFRYCHGKYFYPLRSKISKINKMTPEEYKLDLLKNETDVLSYVLKIPK